MYTDEQNAVRYASGYVVKVLKKQYEKKKGVKARQFMECLMNMSAREEGNSSSSYYDYTKLWIKLVNRGGLFEVNTDSFLFFRAIEVHVQETLCDNLLSGKMDKNEYLFALLRNEDIHVLWSRLNADIEDTDSSNELLTAIIEKWVTLRGFAQVSSWVEDYKRATTETVKKKKSLRKELAAKSDDTKRGKSDDGAGPSEQKSEDVAKKKVRGKKKLLDREEEIEPKRQNCDDRAGDKKTDESSSGSYLKKLLLS